MRPRPGLAGVAAAWEICFSCAFTWALLVGAAPREWPRRMGRLSCLLARRWSADAHVSEILKRHFFRPVDIAQVDENRSFQLGAHAIDIERAKLVPFGQNDEGVCSLGAGVGIA